MKIITWNVNGLRAALRKGVWDWLQSEEADVICLQEVRARPDQLDAEDPDRFHAYQAHWNPADRAGYSGVLSLVRCSPAEVRHGIGERRFDREGRVSALDFEPFVVINAYFPHGGRDHGRVAFKLEFYSRLLQVVDDLHRHGRLVVIAGDFNTAHREIDLRNPQANRNTTGFLPAEREWLDRYCAHGLVDAYRELNPEREQYTWWTYRFNARERNIGWRLDYFFVSAGLLSSVHRVRIADQVMGSDHCPVVLEIH